MRTSHLHAKQPVLSVRSGWAFLVVLAFVLTVCGGSTRETSHSGSGGDPAAIEAGLGGGAGSGGSTVHNPNSGGSSILVPIGSVGGSTGTLFYGPTADASEDATCDDHGALRKAANRGTGPLCDIPGDAGASERCSNMEGTIVFDSEGRAIDNTGINDAGKQAWLDGLANQRWTCLASQTIRYCCDQFE